MPSLIPEALAAPAAALSTPAALGGAFLFFWAALTGGYWWAVWGGIAFTAAALLWLVGDRALTRGDGPGA